MIPLSCDEPGKIGIVKDRASWHLPPEVWTNGNNFRFKERVAKRVPGYVSALGTPTGSPVAIFNVPAINDQSYWFVFTLAKAYVWESGVETDVTNISANYTATAAWNWTGTILAGIPIFNNGKDKPQWWSTVSTGTKLTDLTAWPTNTRARVVRAFGSYLVALNLTESGTNRPHKVLVSAKADPGSVPPSYDPTDATKDAVTFDLTDAEGGELFDGLPLGSQFIFYKKNSTHTMRFIGGQEIWGRDLLFEGSGILATRCVCRFDDGQRHFVATQNDIIVHSGASGSLESVVEGANKTSIFAEIDPTNYVNSYVFEDRAAKELLFCYPTTGNTYPNKAFVYNYESKTQGFRDWTGIASARGVYQISSDVQWDGDSVTWDGDNEQWSNSGREGILFVDPTAARIYLHSSGYAFGSTTPLAFLERTNLALPPRKGSDKADFTTRKLCSRIWPKIASQASCTVQVGAQEDRNGTVTWSSPQTFNPTTQQYLDVEANGRLLAVRFEFQANAAFDLEGYDLDVSVLGKY